MAVSRRDFLRVSAAVGGGGALGGLTGLGANLAPTLARAGKLRIKDAKTSVNRKIVNVEGDPPHRSQPSTQVLHRAASERGRRPVD